MSTTGTAASCALRRGFSPARPARARPPLVATVAPFSATRLGRLSWRQTTPSSSPPTTTRRAAAAGRAADLLDCRSSNPLKPAAARAARRKKKTMKSMSRAVLALLGRRRDRPRLAQNLAKERATSSPPTGAHGGRAQGPEGPRRHVEGAPRTPPSSSPTRSASSRTRSSPTCAPRCTCTSPSTTTPRSSSGSRWSRWASSPRRAGPGVQQNAVITNLDANIGHVEVNLGAGPKTFEVDPKSQLRNFKIGDKVTILIETRDGQPRGRDPDQQAVAASAEAPGRGGGHPGQGPSHRERPHREAVARLQHAVHLEDAPRRPAPPARGGRGPAARSR